jgi:hypothetical protein
MELTREYLDLLTDQLATFKSIEKNSEKSASEIADIGYYVQQTFEANSETDEYILSVKQAIEELTSKIDVPTDKTELDKISREKKFSLSAFKNIRKNIRSIRKELEIHSKLIDPISRYYTKLLAEKNFDKPYMPSEDRGRGRRGSGGGGGGGNDSSHKTRFNYDLPIGGIGKLAPFILAMNALAAAGPGLGKLPIALKGLQMIPKTIDNITSISKLPIMKRISDGFKPIAKFVNESKILNKVLAPIKSIGRKLPVIGYALEGFDLFSISTKGGSKKIDDFVDRMSEKGTLGRAFTGFSQQVYTYAAALKLAKEQLDLKEYTLDLQLQNQKLEDRLMQGKYKQITANLNDFSNKLKIPKTVMAEMSDEAFKFKVDNTDINTTLAVSRELKKIADKFYDIAPSGERVISQEKYVENKDDLINYLKAQKRETLVSRIKEVRKRQEENKESNFPSVKKQEKENKIDEKVTKQIELLNTIIGEVRSSNTITDKLVENLIQYLSTDKSINQNTVNNVSVKDGNLLQTFRNK